MLFKMLQVALDLIKEEKDRLKIINHIITSTKQFYLSQDREVLLSGLQLLIQLRHVTEEERTKLAKQLETLTISNQGYSFINSIVIHLKFSNLKNSISTSDLSREARIYDFRFKKSNKPGLLYEVRSYSYVSEQDLLICGFSPNHYVRSTWGKENCVFIKDPAFYPELMNSNFFKDFGINLNSNLSHLKIWFPKKGAPPLGGSLNELRLIRQSLDCLTRNEFFSLLTDFSVNENKDSAYVQSFCNKHGICLLTPHDIKKELSNREWIDKTIQLRLFDIAMLELTHPAGHPVIASDIFRYLSPTLILGAYSDIDTKVEFTGSHSSKANLPELLFNLTQKSMINEMNNNFLYARDTEHTLLVNYREQLYFNYMSPDFISNLNLNYRATIRDKPVVLDSTAINDFKEFTHQYFSLNPSNAPNNILDFRKKLKETFSKHFETYFYFYVIALSGPISLAKSLLSSVALEALFNFSISKHAIKLVDDDIDKRSDLSWTEDGFNQLKQKNEKLDKSIRLIQRIWRERIKYESKISAPVDTPLEANTLRFRVE
jgi:hypothetical protein